jgi:hypothetical protein
MEVPEIVLREEVPATDSDDEGEIDNNGVEVPICPRDAPRQPQATTIAFNGAGSTRGDAFDLDDDEIDPFRPFRSEEEYRLALWTVKHRLTKAAIDDLTTISGINNVSSATSADTLFKGIDSIASDLDVNSWQRKFICFDMEKDGKSLPNA